METFWSIKLLMLAKILVLCSGVNCLLQCMYHPIDAVWVAFDGRLIFSNNIQVTSEKLSCLGINM